MEKEFIEDDKTEYIGPTHENVVCFDVDDTLVLWGRSGEYDFKMRCPYSGVVEGAIIHKQHVDMVKKHYNDGHFVIVWSGGGAPHAKEAIERLHLSNYVNLIIEKPMQYYDDLDAHYFMHRRTYLNSGTEPIKGPYSPQDNYTQCYSERTR